MIPPRRTAKTWPIRIIIRTGLQHLTKGNIKTTTKWTVDLTKNAARLHRKQSVEDGAGSVKKSAGAKEGGSLRQFRQKRQYEAVRRAAEKQKYSVTEACRALHISRAGYYQWRSGRAGARTVENRRLAGLVKKIHAGNPDKGYRRIRDDLARYYGAPVNDKRALRICRSLGIRSIIKYARHGCTRRPWVRSIWRTMC